MCNVFFNLQKLLIKKTSVCNNSQLDLKIHFYIYSTFTSVFLSPYVAILFKFKIDCEENGPARHPLVPLPHPRPPLPRQPQWVSPWAVCVWPDRPEHQELPVLPSVEDDPRQGEGPHWAAHIAGEGEVVGGRRRGGPPARDQGLQVVVGSSPRGLERGARDSVRGRLPGRHQLPSGHHNRCLLQRVPVGSDRTGESESHVSLALPCLTYIVF